MWKLKKALYGLRSSPQLWQAHFANVMERAVFVRCKSDANLYRHSDGNLFVLCYVDDLLIVGEEKKTKSTFEILSHELVMKKTGQLEKEGDKLDFLGRQLTRTNNAVLVSMDGSYIAKILEEANLERCRPALTPGTDTLKRQVEREEELT